VKAVASVHPELVSAVALHPELPVPEGLETLGRWLTTEPDWEKGAVLHISSAFELEVPVRTFWPREASAHGLLTAVTVYDLIPDMFPGWYLADPGLRRRWRCCRELVRVADAVLTLSETAREDTISLLGVPPGRVTAIGSGTADMFRPAASRPEALKVARSGVRGLRKGFLLYNGAFNPRKNVDRLIEGYASMTRELIDRHQLVIVCDAPPLTRNHYLVMAKDLGVEGRVLIPGYVEDDVFVALHQSAELAVYPSLYEGYGLPVVDAMACGTPAIAGDNSSLRELLPREARFEPNDPWAIAEALSRALTDKGTRRRLLELAKREPPSWDAVAGRAAKVFEDLARRAAMPQARWRTRPRLATVGAPPQLARALRPLAECDQFLGPFEVEDSQAARRRSRPLSWSALGRLDRWRGGYDAVVGWGSNLNEQGMRDMEQLANALPGRAVAVVAADGPGPDEHAISKLESWGVQAVFAGGAGGWERTAQLVVKASQAAQA